jgi:protein SCO1/2
MLSMLLMLLACWGDSAYIVEGTVVKVSAADEVILDHEDIPGLMGPMTMPFQVKDPALLTDLEPGHRVLARLEVEESGGYLTKIRVTGRVPVPDYTAPSGAAPLRVGQVLPATELTLSDGTTTVVGEGQDRPTALTFIYTRCPMPEFCPATVARFQALQEAAGPDIRLLAVTLDPEFDTPEVLAAYATESSANPDFDLALYGGVGFTKSDGSTDIVHNISVVVMDAKGAVIERYAGLDWPIERVLSQLRTGEPSGL